MSKERAQESVMRKEVDILRENASELQRGVTSAQTEKYETTLYRLLNRSEDNTELVNAMNQFLNALSNKSFFGDYDKLLPREKQEALTKLFEEAAAKLNDPHF